MSDVLSASSLFLAVIGLLYSSWYPEVSAALRARAKNSFREDNLQIIQDVKEAYQFRALPLAASSLLLVIILLPDFFKIVFQSVTSLLSEGLGAVKHYNAVDTLFSVMLIICVLFTIHLVNLTTKVRAHYKELDKLGG